MSRVNAVHQAYLELDFKYLAGNLEDEARRKDFETLVADHLNKCGLVTAKQWKGNEIAREICVSWFIDTLAVYFWPGKVICRKHLKIAELSGKNAKKDDRALAKGHDGRLRGNELRKFRNVHESLSNPTGKPDLRQDVARSLLGSRLQAYFFAILDKVKELDIKLYTVDEPDIIRRRITTVNSQPQPELSEEEERLFSAGSASAASA